ncbi:O-antigen ligase family protein [Entomomonas sp. E2T0]|uniref:O-antigen ligase family protein n=1 Tax=Entomomonas sp. E2T0 TaxID=2930213 RepID=UPI00222849F9|nr:O-antigen ligase family protein [Entomomonas sp. E2T0]UYZ84259.1 O-antigen ligase family protein [Entomomonas sp. E2T0]
MNNSRELFFINNLFQYGVIMLIVGLAILPYKLYSQLLNIFLYLPAICLIIIYHKSLLRNIRTTPVLWFFIVLIVWAAITTNWSQEIQKIRELKRLVYIIIFILGCVVWNLKQPKKFENTLFISSLLLAACALIAMLLWPWRNPLIADRMAAFNTLENPIIASYAMGIAFVILHLHNCNKNAFIQIIRFFALLVLLAFIIWTGSRGAIGSLVIYLLLSFFWLKQQQKPWFIFIILSGCILLLIFSSHLLFERGFSYRPAILLTSLQMIIENPMGIGLATPYQIPFTVQLVFSHSHNLFLHIGIGLGMPGLILYLILWVNTGWQAWKNRSLPIGKLLLGIFIFSSIALQFDGIYLWDKPNGIWLMTWLPIAIGFYLTNQKTIYQPHQKINLENSNQHA